MTIKVTVSNDDQPGNDRAVRVTPANSDGAVLALPQDIMAGEKAEFHIWHDHNIIVEAISPVKIKTA